MYFFVTVVRDQEQLWLFKGAVMIITVNRILNFNFEKENKVPGNGGFYEGRSVGENGSLK